MLPAAHLSEAKRLDQAGFQPFQRLYFKTATAYFQIKRTIQNQTQTRTALPLGTRDDFPFLWAESRSSVFSGRMEERHFERAKRENLQLALGALRNRVIAPGNEFSFWRQVGNPTQGRGYQVGREIRWGCVVPAVGGGLCQLSGALLECGLLAGVQLTEVHSHSHRLPGADYRPERDATIFWNYVDFRFKTQSEILIESVLTEAELVLRFWGKSARANLASKPLLIEHPAAHDCLACGIEVCPHHEKTQEAARGEKLIFESDMEFSSWLRKLKIKFLVLAGRSLGRIYQTMGCPVGKAAVLRGRSLAFLVKVFYPFPGPTAKISQDLAPFLGEWLRAKKVSYTLKLEHLPLRELQKQLNHLGEIHPEDSRLGDYRASESLLQQEEAAVGRARALWTDHPRLKELFPSADLEGDFRPASPPRPRGDRNFLFFPGPVYAREGWLELIQAAKRLNLKIICPHPTARGNVELVYIDASSLPWEKVLAYVHPCIFDRPNGFLDRALADGIPIVGTLGVPYRGPLWTECALGDAVDLEEKLRKIQIRQKGNGND